MLAASDLRGGMILRVEGKLFAVIAAEYHAGGGKMGGVAHAKLRNLRTGGLREMRWRPGEAVEEVEVERQTMQFLYADDDMSYFMHPETFEQTAIENERLGTRAAYLKEEMTVPVEFFEGQALRVVLPDIADVRVQETSPPVHSQGSDNVWKDATLENGLEIQVPPFIASGELIRVQIETGTYVERAKSEKKK